MQLIYYSNVLLTCLVEDGEIFFCHIYILVNAMDTTTHSSVVRTREKLLRTKLYLLKIESILIADQYQGLCAELLANYFGAFEHIMSWARRNAQDISAVASAGVHVARLSVVNAVGSLGVR